MRIRRFLHLVIFLIVGLLLWRIVETWRRPLEEQSTLTSQNPAEEKPLPLAKTTSPQVGKRHASTIIEKDLFVPSRSRPQEEVKPAVTVPPPSHLKLVGVILARGKEEAFFADSTQGGKVVRVRNGESLGSYKLVGVAPLQATLTMGQEEGEEVTLPLLVLDSNSATQAPHLIPQINGNQRRARRAMVHDGAVSPDDAPQTESHAIRQNIQQLQQRLRQIRRQAARDGEGEDGMEEQEEVGDENGEQEQEQEEE